MDILSFQCHKRTDGAEDNQAWQPGEGILDASQLEDIRARRKALKEANNLSRENDKNIISPSALCANWTFHYASGKTEDMQQCGTRYGPADSLLPLEPCNPCVKLICRCIWQISLFKFLYRSICHNPSSLIVHQVSSLPSTAPSWRWPWSHPFPASSHQATGPVPISSTYTDVPSW